jgi:hypothetical protein
MRKTYKLEGTCTKASGGFGWALLGTVIKGTLVVEADAEVFRTKEGPVSVSGKVDSAVSPTGADIIAQYGPDQHLDFFDELWLVDGPVVSGSIPKAWGGIGFSGRINDDASRIDGLVLSVTVTDERYVWMLSSAEAEGAGECVSSDDGGSMAAVPLQ